MFRFLVIVKRGGKAAVALMSRSFVLAAALSLGFPAPSSAGPVQINFTELPNEGGIQLTGTDFAGNPISVLKLNAETFGISSPIVPTGYTPDAILSHIGISQQGGDRLFAILETPGGPVSDYVWVHRLNNVFTVIDFVSDIDLPLTLPSTPLNTVVETGALQDVGGYTSDDGTSVRFAVQSDVETVPEPSTWLMMATGILGLLGHGWRQRKKAA